MGWDADDYYCSDSNASLYFISAYKLLDIDLIHCDIPELSYENDCGIYWLVIHYTSKFYTSCDYCADTALAFGFGQQTGKTASCKYR